MKQGWIDMSSNLRNEPAYLYEEKHRDEAFAW